MKFYCIADEDTVRGFRLAGVDGCAVDSGAQAAEAFARATASPEIGILVLTERVAAAIGPQVETTRLERDCPLIVEIPGPEGRRAGRATLRQLVQSAVGIHVAQEEGS
jgi:V/A-type H+-transporting ATPase subunit F